MFPDTKVQILFHISQTIWMVTFGFLFMALALALVSLQQERSKKRPGINLREF